MPTTTDGLRVLCNRPALVDALAMVSAVVPSRSPAPILLCVRIVAKDGMLTLQATDTEIGLDLHIASVEIDAEGEALLPADKFNQIARVMNDATVKIELDRHAANIVGARSKFKIFGLDPSEFPATSDISQAVLDFEIPAGQLRRMIARSVFAVAADNTRYALAGVLIERKGRGLRFVATDGLRLALAKGDCASPADGDSRVIVPAKGLNVLNRLLDDPEAIVRVLRDRNRLVFEIGDSATLVTTLVEGVYPPFEEVIPKEHDRKAVFDSGELSSAIKRAALFTSEESRVVKFSFSGKQLTLKSQSVDMGEAVIEIEATSFEGQPLDIGFRPQFITDVLRIIECQEVSLEMKAPNKPCVLRAGGDFVYVLMPVNT
ncbi:MAG: DNA polymerase III subunit beta [Planctomycetota bacterium]|nr:DNA polymerase III subunit beta [Planctomycetota bacterium]